MRTARTIARMVAALCLAALLPSLVPAQPYYATTVAGDRTGTRLYTLNNGLRVYISVNTEQPRVQTLTAVRAGSKNDPPEATGLAHYLEHMLFKGTSTFGTLNYAKERPYLDRIADMFEEYRALTDSSARKALYHRIDSMSGVAAQYAIPNEYDKITQSLGCTGTNAFTSNDATVYVNNVAANRLKTFLALEGERFKQCVLRLFHTELEAVYEEKNLSLNEDGSLADDTLMRALFPDHTYGTQSTLGTVEHLKNPSMRRIQEYFSRQYVPANMAVILVGDLDPDSAIAWVDAAFGDHPSAPVPYFGVREQPPITSPIVKNVVGPDPEFVTLAFRLPGAAHKDIPALRMCDMILANASAGLIDLNLGQTQKVREPYATLRMMTDFSLEQLGGSPMPGESLEDVTKHLLDQIELLKKGAFDDKLMRSIVQDVRIRQMQSEMGNEGRAYRILQAFEHGMPLESVVHDADALAAVTKADVMRIAKEYFRSNYVVVNKREGDRTDISKVEKPAITPVPLNRDTTSTFGRAIISAPARTIEPRFLDYTTDMQRAAVRPNIPLLAVRNTMNDLFELRYYLTMGTANDRYLKVALDYLDLMSTSALTNEALQQRMYALGMDFGVYASSDRCYITLSGIRSNFKQSVQLMENILATCVGNEASLAAFKQRLLQEREDARKDKSTIYYRGLLSYARYGPRNAVTTDLTTTEINGLTHAQLSTIVHRLLSYPHEVHYWGPDDAPTVAKSIAAVHGAPATFRSIPAAMTFPVRPMDSAEVIFLDHEQVTADVAFFARSFPRFDSTLSPRIRLLNEYFDGGMGSIVFQTIREQKALAYSTSGGLENPYRIDEPYTVMATVGTQADKLHDAITSMQELLTTLPRIDPALQAAKSAIRARLATERRSRMGIIDSYVGARRFGLSTDQAAYTWKQLPPLAFNDVAEVYATGMANRPYTLVVMGSSDSIDVHSLEKYGRVRTVTINDLFAP
ncbi:MAG: insulinase family protein [Bacteroidetes bacterium]|nr:insulinase family protein [Bacteroidota bacterium]